jgi:hypothetical protein
MKNNLFWQVYKNLEKEVLEIANFIYFSDDQLCVYSLKSAEIIMRAAIEIESIAKALYEQNCGNMNPVDDDDKIRDLYFDTDCLNFLELKWKLSKKKVYVTSPYFYFNIDDNKILKPLYKANKRGTSGSDWKQTYQAIKHNRAINIKKANVKILVRVMAALYLLNIYYKDESIFLGKNSTTSSIPSSSEIFSIETIRVAVTKQDDSVDITLSDFHSVESAVLMIKTTKESLVKEFNVMNHHLELVNEKISKLILTDQYKNQNEIAQKALQLVPMHEVQKVLKDTDYEAVIIKPEKTHFYRSQGCSSKYTEEQLKQIENDANTWRTF